MWSSLSVMISEYMRRKMREKLTSGGKREEKYANGRIRGETDEEPFKNGEGLYANSGNRDESRQTGLKPAMNRTQTASQGGIGEEPYENGEPG
jgi:hypothetical protein